MNYHFKALTQTGAFFEGDVEGEGLEDATVKFGALMAPQGLSWDDLRAVSVEKKPVSVRLGN